MTCMGALIVVLSVACFVSQAVSTGFGQFQLSYLPDNEQKKLRSLLAHADDVAKDPVININTVEDRSVAVMLPRTCHRVFFKSLHGEFVAVVSDRRIQSGIPVQDSKECDMLFEPDKSFYGEQLFWYTVLVDGREALHAGMIRVVPQPHPAKAVDDEVDVKAGGWVFIPALENDEDVDMTSVDEFHVCFRNTLKSTATTTANGTTYITVVGITDSTNDRVEVVFDRTTVLCDFDNSLPPASLSRCLATLTVPGGRDLVNLVVRLLPSAHGGLISPFVLNNVPVNRTYFVRLRRPDMVWQEGGGIASSRAAHAVTVFFANETVPPCDVLRVAAVSDAKNGQTFALMAPRVTGQADSNQRLPGLPCFLVGGTMFEEHRNYLSLDPVTLDVVYPTVDATTKAVLETVCHGSWVNSAHSPTAIYYLPDDLLPTVVLYIPNPGFAGADNFTYSLGDGVVEGVVSTGHITIRVHKSQDLPHKKTWKHVIQSYDGTFNNFEHPDFGGMMTPLSRLGPAAYDDGIDAPAGGHRPSARVISNEVFQESEEILSRIGLSELHVHFGQLLTHDLDFSTPLADFNAEGNFVIPIPKDDAYFDSDGSGTATMRFRRTAPQYGTGAGFDVPRQQLNKITAWLDVNVIYGTLNQRNRALRTMRGGKLLHMQSSNETTGREWFHVAPAKPIEHDKSQCRQSVASDASSTWQEVESIDGIQQRCFTVKNNVSATEQHCKPIRQNVEELSLNANGLQNLNLLGKPKEKLFVSGDNRANVQPGLVAMHTLFAREHNTIVDELIASLLVWNKDVTANAAQIYRARHPHASSFHTPALPALPVDPPLLLQLPAMSVMKPPTIPYAVPVAYPYPFDGSEAALAAYDEALFQTARAVLRAKWQAIVWYEWLPALLGPVLYAKMPAYAGYNASADPCIPNEFATAAFRFGHSQIGTTMHRVDDNGCELPAIQLRDAYFGALRLLQEGGVDPVIGGSLLHRAQEVDTSAVNDVRNFLFASHTAGFDLVAMNIQRGRDHGLPSYNDVRRALRLTPRRSIRDITRDITVAERLEAVYGAHGIEDVDLIVGGLAEDHEIGASVGETFAEIIIKTFVNVRDADRFWFENTASPQYDLLTSIAPLEKFRKTRVADVIARNSRVLDGPFGAAMLSCGPCKPVDDGSGEMHCHHGVLSVLQDSLFFAKPCAATQGCYNDIDVDAGSNILQSYAIHARGI